MRPSAFFTDACYRLITLLAWSFISFAALAESPKKPTEQSTNQDAEVTIAFGSCLRQWQPHPIWQTVVDQQPDAYVFLGDNVYADAGPLRKAAEPQRIYEAYRSLEGSEDFRVMKEAQAKGMQWFATWDDHDYGANNAGQEYPYQMDAKKAFLNFFGEATREAMPMPEDQPGIYHRRWLKTGGLSIQVISLDARSFRTPLKYASASLACPLKHPEPQGGPRVSILGKAQWQWLDAVLEEPADLRLVASGIQVLPTEQCFEKWANFPEERSRLIERLSAPEIGPVVLLSGDRHMGEISRLPASNGRSPLLEITASGLNSAIGPTHPLGWLEENALRQGDSVVVNHFGLLKVTAQGLKAELRDEFGELQAEFSEPFLQP